MLQFCWQPSRLRTVLGQPHAYGPEAAPRTAQRGDSAVLAPAEQLSRLQLPPLDDRVKALYTRVDGLARLPRTEASAVAALESCHAL